ncbi:hypothetical protein ACFWVM_08510 [Nocardia fluminea]|uniref:hypothetical protein n=1 Tax=Nocardia fluminea TaxID=134984 RepID=UPI00366488FC
MGALVVSTSSIACGATRNQQKCIEPPTVEVVRDAIGSIGDPVMIGAHRTCDGVIVEGLRLTPGYWPPSSKPVSGNGPLLVTVSPTADRLNAWYSAKSGPDTGSRTDPRVESLGEGRFNVDAPTIPGCWLLRLEVGVGWAVLVTVGDLEEPCPPPDASFA